jgi:hypothetical protein
MTRGRPQGGLFLFIVAEDGQMAKKTQSSTDQVAIHDQTLSGGEGGELHQTAEDGFDILTT